MLNRTIHNFITPERIAEIWTQFNDDPRWRYRVFAQGQYFWWYQVFNDNLQFRADDPDIWNHCRSQVWRDIFSDVQNLAGPDFRIHRFVVNGQTQCQPGGKHRDYSETQARSTTFLIYLNKTWQQDWGGATEFYSDDGQDIVHLEYPEPGKLVEYPAIIMHRAQAPAVPNMLRVTLALQGIYT